MRFRELLGETREESRAVAQIGPEVEAAVRQKFPNYPKFGVFTDPVPIKDLINIERYNTPQTKAVYWALRHSEIQVGPAGENFVNYQPPPKNYAQGLYHQPQYGPYSQKGVFPSHQELQAQKGLGQIWIDNTAKNWASTISHEIQHGVDFYKSGGKAFPNNPVDHQKDLKGYLRQQHEISARTSQAAQEIHNQIDQYKQVMKMNPGVPFANWNNTIKDVIQQSMEKYRLDSQNLKPEQVKQLQSKLYQQVTLELEKSGIPLPQNRLPKDIERAKQVQPVTAKQLLPRRGGDEYTNTFAMVPGATEFADQQYMKDLEQAVKDHPYDPNLTGELYRVRDRLSKNKTLTRPTQNAQRQQPQQSR